MLNETFTLLTGFILGIVFSMHFATGDHIIKLEKSFNIKNNIYICKEITPKE